MTNGARTLSTSQIEELTRNVELPQPRLHPQHAEVILETIHKAFASLLADLPNEVQTGAEKDLNALLVSRLNNIIAEVDPRDVNDQQPWKVLWRQLVNNVSRGNETHNYNARNLEKRPDLNIALTRGHPSFPLVGECKLIEIKAGKTVALYHEKGVDRFRTGDYAWAAGDALMVGYVRDDSRLQGALASMLQPPRTGRAHAVADLLMATDPTVEAATSLHKRTFTYPTRSPPDEKPGDITLWHLWVQAR